MRRAASPDAFYAEAPLWRDELAGLRAVLLKSGLVEALKWGQPCYTLAGAHVVGVAAFKSYFGLWFPQGALLADPEGVLVNAQEGRTQAARQWRMTSAKDIRPPIIAAYVSEAASNARAGRSVPRPEPAETPTPVELAALLETDTVAAARFAAMSPACRREYARYVAEARQAATRERRAAKALPMIRAGAGLNDAYRR